MKRGKAGMESLANTAEPRPALKSRGGPFQPTSIIMAGQCFGARISYSSHLLVELGTWSWNEKLSVLVEPLA